MIRKRTTIASDIKRILNSNDGTSIVLVTIIAIIIITCVIILRVNVLVYDAFIMSSYRRTVKKTSGHLPFRRLFVL